MTDSDQRRVADARVADAREFAATELGELLVRELGYSGPEAAKMEMSWIIDIMLAMTPIIVRRFLADVDVERQGSFLLKALHTTRERWGVTA